MVESLFPGLSRFDWRTILPIAPFLTPWVDPQTGGATWSPGPAEEYATGVEQEREAWESELMAKAAASEKAAMAVLSKPKETAPKTAAMGPAIALVLAGGAIGLVLALSRAVSKRRTKV